MTGVGEHSAIADVVHLKRVDDFWREAEPGAGPPADETTTTT